MFNKNHIGSNFDSFLNSNDIKIPTIIGYIGEKQSGKSYQSEMLIQQGFIKVDFADKLRELCWGILGWEPKNNEEYEKFKLGSLAIKGFENINGRKFLQNVGEGINQIDKNFWCRNWKKQVDILIARGYTNIVVSDIRHENELEMLKSYLNKAIVKVYFCDYNSQFRDSSDAHISESFARKYKQLGYKDLQEIEL